VEATRSGWGRLTSLPPKVGERVPNSYDGHGMSSVDRYERERQFHDATFKHGSRKGVAKYYAADRASRRFYHARLGATPAGSRVLEYGCGRGSAAFALARRGLAVTGIDLSSEGISHARELADRDRLKIDFEVMNAEHLYFDDSSFDLVCGSAILHHLDLETAYGEIARVLSPGGRGIFVEPLGHNPVINLYRRATPGLRTVDEHPLRVEEIRSATDHFASVRATFFSLATLAAVPLRSTPVFERALAALEAVDRLLFRVPVLRHAGWQVVIELDPLDP
jgi:SAM-dependent methyltransferase